MPRRLLLPQRSWVAIVLCCLSLPRLSLVTHLSVHAGIPSVPERTSDLDTGTPLSKLALPLAQLFVDDRWSSTRICPCCTPAGFDVDLLSGAGDSLLLALVAQRTACDGGVPPCPWLSCSKCALASTACDGGVPPCPSALDLLLPVTSHFWLRTDVTGGVPPCPCLRALPPAPRCFALASVLLCQDANGTPWGVYRAPAYGPCMDSFLAAVAAPTATSRRSRLRRRCQ